MYKHNNSIKEGGYKGMMWMIIPCLLLLGILFFGGSTLFSAGYLWPVLIGAFVVAHIWMMFKGHSGHGDAHTENKTNDISAPEQKTKDEDNKHTHGECCH